ncbi:hypothetical protein C8R45DRAFT_982750 [Mycena sanguinolenta]|nr:hypothetical protein C8R45DRAFT_982750 [Mycena sanguinolenta]
MFRKISKSSLNSKSSVASQTLPQASAVQVAWPFKQRLKTGLKTASDSNLPARRKSQKDVLQALAPKPSGNNPAVETRGRRATIATGHPDFVPPVPKQRYLNPVELKSRRIVVYMPELYDEVDPIRVAGKFYTWDDPSSLNYMPLHPPPRKSASCGRIAVKPKHDLGVCSKCSSKRTFSCARGGGTPTSFSASRVPDFEF